MFLVIVGHMFHACIFQATKPVVMILFYLFIPLCTFIALGALSSLLYLPSPLLH